MRYKLLAEGGKRHTRQVEQETVVINIAYEFNFQLRFVDRINAHVVNRYVTLLCFLRVMDVVKHCSGIEGIGYVQKPFPSVNHVVGGQRRSVRPAGFIQSNDHFVFVQLFVANDLIILCQGLFDLSVFVQGEQRVKQ